MTDPKTLPDALKTVTAQRIFTGDEPGAPAEEAVNVVCEAALTIDVERVESYTLLCTPADIEELTAGFLLSEGVIDSMDEVQSLEPCKDDPMTIRVRLSTDIPRISDAGRNLLIVSSCGLCGSENLESRLQGLPEVGDTLRVEARVLRAVNDRLRQSQPLFAASGGSHAVGIFDAGGELLSVAEDAGRHNALDKAIGYCLLSGQSPAGLGAVLSGRVSLEMVGKCARAGIELISAISAPTSLAVEVAEACGITLCAFVRDTRATVFTHSKRVVDQISG
jgi:FdhD protein